MRSSKTQTTTGKMFHEVASALDSLLRISERLATLSESGKPAGHSPDIPDRPTVRVVVSNSRSFRVVDSSGFDYSSFRLRRPVPCPTGTYCHPGSASDDLGMHNFTMPQPCLEVNDLWVKLLSGHLSRR